MEHPRWIHRLFSDDDLDVIAAAVTEAERHTSGELRVHLERRLPRAADGTTQDALERARELFAALGMQQTRERNGVLVYLAVADRKLAVVGDEGVHARVGDAYWAGVRDAMVARLRDHAPRDAVMAAVHDLGAVLREHFPRRPDDTDELSDRVSVS